MQLKHWQFFVALIVPMIGGLATAFLLYAGLSREIAVHGAQITHILTAIDKIEAKLPPPAYAGPEAPEFSKGS